MVEENERKNNQCNAVKQNVQQCRHLHKRTETNIEKGTQFVSTMEN
jgi:hypothetical protein